MARELPRRNIGRNKRLHAKLVKISEKPRPGASEVSFFIVIILKEGSEVLKKGVRYKKIKDSLNKKRISGVKR